MQTWKYLCYSSISAIPVSLLLQTNELTTISKIKNATVLFWSNVQIPHLATDAHVIEGLVSHNEDSLLALELLQSHLQGS